MKKRSSVNFFFLTLCGPSLLFALNAPLPELSKLKDKDPSVRLTALSAIEKRSAYDEETLLALIETLKDPVPYLQSEAMFLLERAGKPAIPYLLKEMDRPDETQKWRIFHILAKNKVRKIIPLLKQNIKAAQNHNGQTLLNTSLYALGLVGKEKEAAELLMTSADKMALMGLHKMAKTDLHAFLKGIYLTDKFYEHSERLVKDVVENLKFSSQTLMSLLSEGHPAYQAGALFILRHIHAQGTAPFFEKGLYSPYPAVQVQAIQGVDRNQFHRLFPKLLSFIQPASPEAVQRASLETILAHSDQLTPEERTYLESDKISKTLMAKLNDKNTAPRTQQVALEALFQLKSEKLFDILIANLRNTKTPYAVQRQSIKLLGQMGRMAPPKAPKVEAILLSFLDQPDEEKIAAALEALFQLKSEKLPDILIANLKNKKTPYTIQLQSIELLGRMGRLAPPKADEILFAFLNISHFTYYALKALYNLSPPYIETLLISYLSHTDPFIKIFAIKAVGDLKSTKSVNFLISNLSSTSAEITSAVIDALERIGDRKAVTPITRILLQSRDHPIIHKALSALAHFKDPSSIPYLISFLEHENLSVRKSAAMALKELGSKGSQP